MRIFNIQNSSSVAEIAELDDLSAAMLGRQSYVWIACARDEFEGKISQIQSTLNVLTGLQLVDLHVSDLRNNHLPSHYDYTSEYDVLVFRRLATGAESDGAPPPPDGDRRRNSLPILRRIDTSPVGFALFDRVVLTVHPSGCPVRTAYASRLLQATSAESRAAGVRLPNSPADLMLRVVNLMVDGYLELRRELTRQLDHWQAALIEPTNKFNDWGALLDARLSLHQLDEICEDQRSAIQDWIEALKTWPEAASPAEQREQDLLHVRSRDVLEHIERVVHHVQRMEQSTETAVQMHFSVQGSRTNEIMRTLTVLTAIFLPLNFMTGFFGMNFEFLPLIHHQTGFWWAIGGMALTGISLLVLFWRKHYLGRSSR